MSGSVITLHQKLFRDLPSDESIDVVILQDRDLCETLLDDFLLTVEGSVGIAATFGRKSVLSSIAVASESLALYIRLTDNGRASNKGRSILRDRILCNPRVTKLSLDMDRLCTSLYLDHRLHITNAVDLQSTLNEIDDRQAFETIMDVLGGEENLNKQDVFSLFVKNSFSSTPQDVALRAWAMGRASNFSVTRCINTIVLDQKVP